MSSDDQDFFKPKGLTLKDLGLESKLPDYTADKAVIDQVKKLKEENGDDIDNINYLGYLRIEEIFHELETNFGKEIEIPNIGTNLLLTGSNEDDFVDSEEGSISGYHFKLLIKNSYNKPPELLEIRNLVYLKQFSHKDNEFSAYKHKNRDEYYFVVRGTDNMADVKIDAKMVFGDYNQKRFCEAKEALIALEETLKINKSQIHVIGHSLGGTVTEIIGEEGHANVIPFNRYVGDYVSQIRKTKNQINIKYLTDFASFGDVIYYKNCLILTRTDKHVGIEHTCETLDYYLPSSVQLKHNKERDEYLHEIGDKLVLPGNNKLIN